MSSIEVIYIPIFPTPDKMVSGLTSDGDLSVKSGAHLLQGTPMTNKVDFKWVWNINAPLKASSFL